ncbi:hypothetical protein [Pararhodobacter sp.]
MATVGAEIECTEAGISSSRIGMPSASLTRRDPPEQLKQVSELQRGVIRFCAIRPRNRRLSTEM